MFICFRCFCFCSFSESLYLFWAYDNQVESILLIGFSLWMSCRTNFILIHVKFIYKSAFIYVNFNENFLIRISTQSANNHFIFSQYKSHLKSTGNLNENNRILIFSSFFVLNSIRSNIFINSFEIISHLWWHFILHWFFIEKKNQLIYSIVSPFLRHSIQIKKYILLYGFTLTLVTIFFYLKKTKNKKKKINVLLLLMILCWIKCTI